MRAQSRAQCLHLLVLSTLGQEASTFYKRLADLISSKHQKQYSSVISWLRRCLSLAVLRSIIMCVRGSGSSHHQLRCEVNITLTSAKIVHKVSKQYIVI